MSKLELFWDIGSPYTYLALTQVEGLRKRTGAEVVLRPFLLGGVFKSAGNTMPAQVPAKAAYMIRDLERWRDHYGVKMRIPPEEVVFPINSLVAMRAAIAADQRGRGDAYCFALCDAYWVEGRDVSTPEEVAPALRRAGLDPEEIFRASATPEVKDRLRANTDEAVARGAFGAPALFVGDDLYWGNDRLPFVEARLLRSGGNKPR